MVMTAIMAVLAAVPSVTWSVRACDGGTNAAKRLWQGIPPMVKEWECARRAETLSWFEHNQFGKTPIGLPEGTRFGEREIVFGDSGIRINITCHIPAGADRDHPVPVFLFGDHRGGSKAPDFAQEWYPDLPTNAIVARGYAFVRWNFNDVALNVSHYQNTLQYWPKGIIAWQECGDRNATNITRKADGWGTIGAWAWGNSRVMDWIERQGVLDATRVAVVGHSRGGKTALWTAAQDERFAMAVSNGSGCGGARLARARDAKAESFYQIIRNFPSWFCPAFSRWIRRDAEVPHDADDLIRLIAPRLVYVASGSADAWAGPRAERAAWEEAHDLYRAYGVEDRMGYHCHEGPHMLRPDDWERFMDFADRRLKAPSDADSEEIERKIGAALADGTRRVELGRNPARVDGSWMITRAILLPDDFTLIIDGCCVELAEGVQDNIMRNAGAAEGACKPNRGIRILGRNGATLSGGRRNHYLPRRSGDPNGWQAVGILLCEVSDYEISGLAMEETQCWAISQERCHHGWLHDIKFNSSNIMYNQDGIDLRKGCHDIVVENISGQTGDDTVALTAYRDPVGAPPRYGMQIGGNFDCGSEDDVYNVTIRNIHAKSSGGHGVIRLLCCDGIKMHHITVTNVVETTSGKDMRSHATIRIGDKVYHKVRHCEMGEMHHVEVSGVVSASPVAVWVKGPLCDSSVTGIVPQRDGKRYDITASLERVKMDE